MFSLNREIKKWRRKLYFTGAFQKSDIDELEAHLREEVEELIALGYSEEQAFHKATHRLGSPEILKTEFIKVNFKVLWGKRLLWGFIVLLCFSLVFSQCSNRVQLTERSSFDLFESASYFPIVQFRQNPYKKLIYAKDVDLLKAHDTSKARQMIQQKQMTWPQIEFTDAIKEKFHIQRFSCNILISPAGEMIDRAPRITRLFLYRHIIE
ncbi:hypothetical protein GWN91_06390 [Candidatus Saccharibacteria bacterium]|nr:hypothetical protein [Candidatus Saccharibacteria bacterium]NIV72679.1 hypothetical protein [Calditrichia bacterium]NIW79576.1 hypothetical protein [Calditrichia bacterium]